jgi:hypothetical protein
MAEENNSGKAVYRIDVFKLYRVEMKLQHDNLALFDFED